MSNNFITTLLILMILVILVLLIAVPTGLVLYSLGVPAQTIALMWFVLFYGMDKTYKVFTS